MMIVKIIFAFVTVKSCANWCDDLELFSIQKPYAIDYVKEFVPNGILILYALYVCRFIRRRKHLCFDDFMSQGSHNKVMVIKVMIWVSMIIVQVFVANLTSYIYFVLFALSLSTILFRSSR
jgi:hypothetical protein